jgi:hypothetical protein
MKENELFKNIEMAINTQKPVWLGVWGMNDLDVWLTVGQEPTPQRTEQNFCSRCGKRTPDLITIHTCTPPKENT